MAIQVNEIQWYKPEVINDAEDNGGPVSDIKIPDGVKNNVWPDVSQTERITGSTKYRKSFIKIDNPDELRLLNPKIFIETQTPGDDRIVIIPATLTDTQGDLTGDERMYGCGVAAHTIEDLADSVMVKVECIDDEVFKSGDLVRVSTKGSVDDTDGISEFVRLKTSLGVTRYEDNHLLLAFEIPFSFGTGMVLDNAKIASVYEPDDGDVFAFWEKRTVPAGADSLLGNKVVIAISGESE